jgi:protein FRG1
MCLTRPQGKFLLCDAHGLISADREVRGPQEEWTPVLTPDGMVVFMNIYEKYLAVDAVAGGTLQLRGDSEEVGILGEGSEQVQEGGKRRGE